MKEKQTEPVSVELSLTEVDALIAGDRLDEAESILIELHQKNPEFADVCNRIGQLYFKKGDYLRAKEFLAKAVRVNPDYTEASLNLAVTLNEIGRYEEAKDVVQRAQNRVTSRQVSLDPFVAGKLANKHVEVGDIYRELGLLEEGLDEYRKALDLAPGFADVQVKMGVILREMGHFDDALEVFARTATARPDFLDARIQLGITYFSRGFLDRAAAEWREVLKTHPMNPKARMYLSFLENQEETL